MSPQFPNGVSFNQAGVLHLVGWHEVEDGNMILGLVEITGKADTYTRRSKFSTGAAKRPKLDKCDP